jgi:actin-related protein
MENEVKALVIANGSGMITAGFAGDDLSKSSFPAIVSVASKNSEITVQDIFVGEEARSKSGILDLHYPIDFYKVFQ